MSSEGGYQQTEPKPCTNGCGFFGSPANMDLCSKCYRDLRVKEGQSANSDRKASVAKLDDDLTRELEARFASSPLRLTRSEIESTGEAAPAKRCSICKKKVGLLGFQCRCGPTFCGAHRYPEEHRCKFDYKAAGKDAIARHNPVVKADKMARF